ncbi:MAG: type II toxin-antitoxin system PemK/MazF family toxin [Propionibacteriaceae bacterium]|jgi:mRNA interferase MazF|nr:type II toxin-antitoxin system PemK/MazF family toxin [Propionibacteriaceae bacterium]
MISEPRPGDVYWFSGGSQRGHEQSGRRPVLVVSDSRLNSLGLVWIVPLTTTDRGWPLHVPLKVGNRVSVAMCEQLRSASIERLGQFIGDVGYETLSEVRAVIRRIVGR